MKEWQTDNNLPRTSVPCCDSSGDRQQDSFELRDELTGLLRREAFLECVRERVVSHPPCTFIMVCFDIDKFSAINDRYGHERGDMLLRFIAKTINNACEREDAICSRLHTDHFAICARNDETIGERFFKHYSDALQKVNDGTEIHMSFGLCQIDDPSLSPEVILDHAALARRSVKGSFAAHYAYYDDALRRTRLREQEIESQMNAALQRGEFDVYIQPQFELASGRLIGGEALARWFHPDWGMVLPGEFIPIFEQNGFIYQLDCFVWERACQLLQKWIAVYRENVPSVSVNISRADLFVMDVAQRLCALTEKYDVPPRLLRLEITESAYADSPGQLLDAVRALQAGGFSVEMDDFGSGYSSLNTLKDVPVNALKLDLRFLEGDSISGRGGSIINSVIRMTRWLELPVIAEGVETQRQADYLHSVGCDYVQGYLYARPLPVAEFETLMHSTPITLFNKARNKMDMADANAFWNPDSQETLIFNSYVGGAAIMEYADGRPELLRANQKFLDILHAEDIARCLHILEETVFPEDRAAFIQMLEKAIETAGETTCTICLGENKLCESGKRWLRSRARMLCSSRNRSMFYIAVEDITLEREAQQRFHVSQDTLMAAAAHTHLQYWTYNLIEHTSIQGAESHEYISGVPPYLENYPQSLFDMGYIHPDHIEAYRKLHTDLQAGAHTVSMDALTGGEGRWEWRKIRYTAVRDDDGTVRTAIGTSESLTAYKQLEERFVIAAQQSGLLTWMLDIPARCIHTDMLAQTGIMNQSCIEDMPESFLRRGLIHPEDADDFRAVYERMYAGESRADATLRCKALSGDSQGWRWFRMTFTAIADKDGRTGLAVCTAMDVTEQVNMQRRYREAMIYYEQLDPKDYIIMLHANITKGTLDIPGKGAVAYAQGVDTLMNISDEAERASVEAFLNQDYLLNEFSKGVSLLHREYHLTFPDGTERWVRTSIRLLMDVQRQELCAFIYAQDINEERMKTLVFERIVLDDYDFVTIIDTEHDRYLTYITDSSDVSIPSPEEYSFSQASEMYAADNAPEEDARYYTRETRIPYMIRRLAEAVSYSFSYRKLLSNGCLRKKRISIKLIDARTRHVCLTQQDIG